jgi:hypothetical protein
MFALFTVIFIAACYLHFAFALRVLRKLNSPPDEIDVEYVRIENFKATRVRGGSIPSAVSADLFTPSPPAGVIHVQGDCLLPTGVRTLGVVADGALTMEPDSELEQFADCRGAMTIGRNCTLGLATSATSILIEAGSKLRSASAPEIRTSGPGVSAVAAPSQRLTIPGISDAGYAGSALHKLSEDTWICEQTLNSAEPILARSKLIVTGSFTAAPGSELLDDVKASGDIRIGIGSVCHGNLVSGGNLVLSEGVRFEGALHAEGSLVLGAGVKGGVVERVDLNQNPPRRVVAYAAGVVTLGPGIVIRGKVASRSAIQVVA